MKHWWQLRRDQREIDSRIARVGRYVVDGVCLIALVGFGVDIVKFRTFDDHTPFEKGLALVGIALVLGRWLFLGIRPSRMIAARMEELEEEEEQRGEKLDETWEFRKH